MNREASNTPPVPHEDLVERVRKELRRLWDAFWRGGFLDRAPPFQWRDRAQAELHARLQAAEEHVERIREAMQCQESELAASEARVRELEEALRAIRDDFGRSRPSGYEGSVISSEAQNIARAALAKETEA